MAGTSIFVTAAPKGPPESENALENTWELRKRALRYAFFTQTLELLKDHGTDWGPRMNDFIETEFAWRNAYKEAAAPAVTGGSEVTERVDGRSKTVEANEIPEPNNNDQTPVPSETPYTATPFATAGAVTPAFSLGDGAAVFTPMVQTMATPAAVTAHQEKSDQDAAAAAEFLAKYEAARADNDKYNEILEVPVVVMYKHNGEMFEKTAKGSLRVQSKAATDDQPQAFRIVIRDGVAGHVRLNAAVTKSVKFVHSDDRKGGSILFTEVTENGHTMYRIKASAAEAQRLFENLQAIQKKL